MPSRAVVAVSLAALAFALYAPVRQHAFVGYGDDRTLVSNPNLRGPLDAAALRQAFEPYEAKWIPLTWLSLHVDWRLHGDRPAGYLLENAALHAAGAALLFLALSSLTGAAGRSAFVAAVFAAHPLQVEAVAWASQRAAVLSGLFWMLGLLAYARYAAAPTLARYALVLVSLALGLLAKPSLATFPLVLWLLDAWPLGRLRPGAGADEGARADARRALVEKLPMWLLVAAASAATFLARRSRGASTQLSEVPLLYRLMNAAETGVASVADAFWPSGLAVLYPNPGLAISPWLAGVCALALVAATVAALRVRRTRPYLTVGWLWYLVTLVPFLGVVQVGTQARADRYTYVPLVGLAIALAWGAADLARARGISRRAVAAAAALAVAALAAGTRLQLRHWRDAIALFERAVVVSPDGALPHHQLGLALVDAARPLEGRPHLERALALGAESAEARTGLALAYEELGHYPEAIEHARAALRIAPGHPSATRELVRILATCPDPELRDPAEAVRLAEAARDRAGAPDADLFEALAVAYAAAARSAEAQRALEEAVRRAELAGDQKRARALRGRLAILRSRSGTSPLILPE